MFYLKVFKDGKQEILRFISRSSMNAFRHLTTSYMDDSGAGNGYGAYWIMFDEKHFHTHSILDDTEYLLDAKLVNQMLHSLLCARLAISNPKMISWNAEAKETNGHGSAKGIDFKIDEIPPRLVPTVGDMYRIPRTKLTDNPLDGRFSEGRVLEEKDGVLTVRACWDEDSKTGEWKEGDRKTYTIEANRVMKINDWLASHRHPKEMITA